MDWCNPTSAKFSKSLEMSRLNNALANFSPLEPRGWPLKSFDSPSMLAFSSFEPELKSTNLARFATTLDSIPPELTVMRNLISGARLRKALTSVVSSQCMRIDFVSRCLRISIFCFAFSSERKTICFRQRMIESPDVCETIQREMASEAFSFSRISDGKRVRSES